MNVYTQEDAKILTLKAFKSNLFTIPKSTMQDSINEEALVEVYKINPKEYPNENLWLLDILDDKNIPYKIISKDKIVAKINKINTNKIRFGGRKGLSKQRHIITHHIFVYPEHARKVKKLIKLYENAENIEVLSEYETGKEAFDINDMPQTQCPSCGKECDSDYIKCPYCKNKLY